MRKGIKYSAQFKIMSPKVKELQPDHNAKTKKKNIGATACRPLARAETFNGLQKVLQIRCVPGPTTL